MKLNHHESNPKHPVKLIEIECPECYHIKYGELAMVDHLVYGERWNRASAEAFVLSLELLPRRTK